METNRNPAAALVALTHPAATKVGRFEVRELTLGTLAVLERIGSPVLDPAAPRDLAGWTETLYAMTRPGREAAAALGRGREAFADEAMAWADTVTNAEAVELLHAVAEALGRLYAANPDPDAPEEGESFADPTETGATAG